jgi:AcrR family transcriptional regulator
MAKLNSKRRIQRALFELLREHSIDDITVSEVVERAGVSRTSYYRAYGSLQGVVDDALDELFAEVESLAPRGELLSGDDETERFERSLLEILKLYHDNADQLQMLLDGSADKTFRNRLFAFTLDALPTADGQDDSALEAMKRTYMAAGTATVICQWVGGGCVLSMEDMTAFIMQKRREALSG